MRIMKGIYEIGASGIAEISNRVRVNSENIYKQSEWSHNKSTESHSILNKTQPNPATNYKAATLFIGIKHKGESLNLWCNINHHKYFA